MAFKCQTSLLSIHQVVSRNQHSESSATALPDPSTGSGIRGISLKYCGIPRGISASKGNLQIQTCSVASPVARCNQHCLIPVGVTLHFVACIPRAFQPSQTTSKSIRVMSPRSSGPAPAEFGKFLSSSSLPMALMTCSAARCGLNHRKRVSEMNSARNFSRIT